MAGRKRDLPPMPHASGGFGDAASAGYSGVSGGQENGATEDDGHLP